jgi:alkanesulfonate monooxygenase SsuD/methylene tetrahydromethanopterin reductase-like flavin-dependent oxidoreductase (luciferase family)
VFTVRFDMRNPEFTGRETAPLYSTAVDMAAYADEHGAMMAVLSEHHAAADGHLASPLVFASAISARTTNIPIVVAALLVPLHDPVRLAEDMVAVDLISGGRVSYVAGLGYRPEEFDMFGFDISERGRRMDECLEALQAAFTGEPFEYAGRQAHVTPAPLTEGGPNLFYGGGSKAAAHRAAKFGLGFFPQSSDHDLETLYVEECGRLGIEPGTVVIPTPGSPTSVFVSDDVDATWEAVGPNFLAEAMTHAEWMGDDSSAASSHATTIEALRAENGAFRVVDPAGAVDLIHEHGVLQLHPLCGGADPDIGWESLRLTVEKVLPNL